MVPASILAQAKALADEFRVQERLEDLVWRYLILVIGGFALIIGFNIANGIVFRTTLCELFALSESLSRAAAIFMLVVIIGGLFFSANAFVAWLELMSFRRDNPSVQLSRKNQRLFRPATWVPVVPVVLLPALFNAFFSVQYFFAVVAVAFVVMLVVMVASDV